jgi:hypothetical protein
VSGFFVLSDCQCSHEMPCYRPKPGRVGASKFLGDFARPCVLVRSWSNIYYCLRRKWDWGTPTTFGSVTRGKVGIFLCEGAQGQAGMWMSIFMDQMGALHEGCKRNGAIIRLPPANMPWGSREMNVEDPDGHLLRMRSPATGPADEEGLKRFSEIERLRD